MRIFSRLRLLFLECFTERTWARRRLGGYWERWYFVALNRYVWIRRRIPYRVSGQRPAGCRQWAGFCFDGYPEYEDHGPDRYTRR